MLFHFEHLPPQFCLGCRRLGHKVSNSNKAATPPLAMPPPSGAQLVSSVGPSEQPGSIPNETRTSNSEPLILANVAPNLATTVQTHIATKQPHLPTSGYGSDSQCSSTGCFEYGYPAHSALTAQS